MQENARVFSLNTQLFDSDLHVYTELDNDLLLAMCVISNRTGLLS